LEVRGLGEAAASLHWFIDSRGNTSRLETAAEYYGYGSSWPMEVSVADWFGQAR
jgi:hypothetical protein